MRGWRYSSSFLMFMMARTTTSSSTTEYDPDIPKAIETVISHCSDGVEVEGAMVGWLNHKVIPIQTGRDLRISGQFIRFGLLEKRHYLKMLPIMNITRTSPLGQVNWVLENVAIHMYVFLTGSFSKFNHNLFRLGAVTGPFAYLDHDRSLWFVPATNRTPEASLRGTLFKYCKFPEHITSRLLALAPLDHNQERNPITLGSLIRAATIDLPYPYMKPNVLPFFSAMEARVLDANVQHLVTGIRRCIDKHGVENVLVPEPWLMYSDDYLSRFLDMQYGHRTQEQREAMLLRYGRLIEQLGPEDPIAQA